MNTLLIGSNDIPSELLERLQKNVMGSIFLAVSVQEALQLVQKYSFRFIVMIIRFDGDYPLFQEIINDSPSSLHIVCGKINGGLNNNSQHAPVACVPDIESLITLLEYYEERRYREINLSTKPNTNKQNIENEMEVL